MTNIIIIGWASFDDVQDDVRRDTRFICVQHLQNLVSHVINVGAHENPVLARSQGRPHTRSSHSLVRKPVHAASVDCIANERCAGFHCRFSDEESVQVRGFDQYPHQFRLARPVHCWSLVMVHSHASHVGGCGPDAGVCNLVHSIYARQRQQPILTFLQCARCPCGCGQQHHYNEYIHESSEGYTQTFPNEGRREHKIAPTDS